MNKAKRVAIVTGGTRGIGRAISKALLASGYDVAANYGANEEAAQRFERETNIRTYRWDVGDFDACAAGVEAVQKTLGPVDILINNAGIVKDAMLHKMDAASWASVIRTNLDSVFNMTRLLIEGMRTRNFGRIISISSVNGQMGQAGQTNYAAAKAGIVGFTKALAREGAKKGVTANVVSPGYVNTDMLHAMPQDVLEKIVLPNIPVGRLGEADELARCVLFLAAEEAGWITGTTLSVNGGQYME